MTMEEGSFTDPPKQPEPTKEQREKAKEYYKITDAQREREAAERDRLNEANRQRQQRGQGNS